MLNRVLEGQCLIENEQSRKKVKSSLSKVVIVSTEVVCTMAIVLHSF